MLLVSMAVALSVTHCALPHALGPEGGLADRPNVLTDMGTDRTDVQNDSIDTPDIDVVEIDMPTMLADADGGTPMDASDAVDVPNTMDRPDTANIIDVIDVMSALDARDGSDVVSDQPNAMDVPSPPNDSVNTDVMGADRVMTDVPDLPLRCADIVGEMGVQVRRLRNGNGSWNALCDFSSAGGPWTLLAKVDGTDDGWRYDSSRWTDMTLLNDGNVNANREGAKYQGFVSLSFSAMRVVTEVDLGANTWRQNALSFAHDSMGQSLQQLFSSGNPITIAGTTRADWLRLIPTVLGVANPLLQDFCNQIAFNSRSGNGFDRGSVRLGIITNDNNNCNNAAAWIGAGGSPTDRAGASLTAGNRHPSFNPLDIRRTPGWFFLWGR
jgi:hypothetical protein